jgi:DnaJ family protein C protein 9
VTGSEEERNDVKAAYTESAGDIEHILANCMSADALSAEEHFTTLINAAIEAGDLKATKAWKRTLKDAKGRERRAAVAQDEAREAEAMAKELGVHDKLFGSKKKGKGAAKADEGAADEDALRALIQQKGKQRMESTISALEAKYAALEQEAAKACSKRKGAAVEEEEPPARKGKKAKKDSGPTEEEFAAIQAKMMAGKGAKGSSSKSKGKK